MSWLLFILALLAFFLGAVVLLVHAAAGLLIWLIAAVLFVGTAILDAIERKNRRARKESAEPDDGYSSPRRRL